MDLVRANFNDRKDEIDLYFEFIDFLDNIEKTENMRKSNHILYNKDVEKIIRANSLLMLYNLVESTLVTGIEEVYSALKENNITYSQVRREIREIWFNYRFSNAYDRKAHYDTYKKTAEKIITSIMLNEPLILDRKATGISGNLDATSIRDVCKKHGIQFNTPGNCHGGEKLTQVKDQRNQLAHGTLSFVECGRDFTVEDLHVIKEEVENFLSGFIDSIESYYDNEEYLIK
ncbi:MAG: MAE_28990/MAE_18760 family HEPN-like nuclease [Lactobacillus iners]|uniref:MAE_28990/MAE_18760 family HEPN-like nuclease n=1 Tax=uncultured Megasphaera sp. TaxID=165188 RepID=UPI0025938331|nr:MAE_28990/MAE_18760 family HEPN-like nuclease [uncultured Megasphaera sp.]MCT7757263.1 MAE_28990/MAE_18760 family HEPN-like nuclease [Lactobacillus iners]